MASAFSNTSLPFAASDTRRSSRATSVLSSSLRIPRSPRGRPMPGFLHLFTPSRWLSTSFKVADSNLKAINGEDREENSKQNSSTQDKTENLLSMKSLFHAYKVAVLNGDEKSISDLEMAIYSIEKEKNELSNKVGEISADIALSKEKFLRLNADLDNFRKRSEKDCNTLTSDFKKELIESLLPLVDSFEKAKQQIRPEAEKEKKIDVSYQGIYKQFVETMRSLRVAVVPTIGKQYNPSVHEAVARVESQQFREGIVIEEVCRGFVLGDRLLRPAKVKVSSGPGPRKTPATENPVEEPTQASKPNEARVPVADIS